MSKQMKVQTDLTTATSFLDFCSNTTELPAEPFKANVAKNNISSSEEIANKMLEVAKFDQISRKKQSDSAKKKSNNGSAKAARKKRKQKEATDTSNTETVVTTPKVSLSTSTPSDTPAATTTAKKSKKKKKKKKNTTTPKETPTTNKKDKKKKERKKSKFFAKFPKIAEKTLDLLTSPFAIGLVAVLFVLSMFVAIIF